MTEGKLGILAGSGDLPWIAARNALKNGEELAIFPFTEDDPPSDLAAYCQPVILTKFFSSVIKSLQKAGVRRLLLLGKARREMLYGNARFDLRSAWLLLRMVSQSDTNIFLYLAHELERRGVTILEQPIYLKEFFLNPGRYGKRLSSQEVGDISMGIHYARLINDLDIGQTLVCGRRAILAVECAEGTDACIVRGGKLFKNRGAVVCKVAKVKHDMRFDMPVVGASTLSSMQESSCRVLALEAARTFVVEPEKFLSLAKKAGITVIALDPEKSAVREIKKLNGMF